jgi:hypothetical protein
MGEPCESQRCGTCHRTLWPLFVCPYCESPGARRFHHPASLRAVRLRSYYHTLNEHLPLTQDLRALAMNVTRVSLPSRRSIYRAVGVQFPHWEYLPSTRTYDMLPPWLQLMLCDFAARWRIPRPSGSEFWQGEPADVRAVWFSVEPVLCGVSPEHLELTLPSIGYQYRETAVCISIPNFPKFIYDPTEHARRAVRKLADAAAPEQRTIILARAAAAEADARKAGWRLQASRYQRRGELEREARRLFRYTVLDMSLAEVLDAEIASATEDQQAAKNQANSVQAVNSVIRHWARDLGVQLPAHHGGRPRRAQQNH